MCVCALRHPKTPQLESTKRTFACPIASSCFLMTTLRVQNFTIAYCNAYPDKYPGIFFRKKIKIALYAIARMAHPVTTRNRRILLSSFNVPPLSTAMRPTAPATNIAPPAMPSIMYCPRIVFFMNTTGVNISVLRRNERDKAFERLIKWGTLRSFIGYGDPLT